MRVIGQVESHRGLGPQDHLCWVHGDPSEYRSRVTDFFAEGLQQGLRVAYAGPGEVRGLRKHLGSLGDLDGLLARDAVRLISFEEIYGAGHPVDPAEVVTKYAAATEEALADGYRGLRVSADVTDMVRGPEQQDAFARCEFLVDRYASRHPFSAMCAYRFELGDAVTDLACLHAAAPAGVTPFQVFACYDGAVGLLGEIDQTSESAFTRALERVWPAPGSPSLIFDMSAVRFMDHRALLALDAYARKSLVPVILRSPPPVVRRIARLLDLEHLVSSGGIM